MHLYPEHGARCVVPTFKEKGGPKGALSSWNRRNAPQARQRLSPAGGVKPFAWTLTGALASPYAALLATLAIVMPERSIPAMPALRAVSSGRPR